MKKEQSKIIKKAFLHLRSVDQVMNKLLNDSFDFKFEDKQPSFASFVEVIISQQLSGNVSSSIYSRLEKTIKKIIPSNLLNHNAEELKKCGISNSKVNFITQLAEKFVKKPNYIDLIKKKNDLEAFEEIKSNYGMGEWSASIILISNFGRLDIFPEGDVTLNKCIYKLYGIDTSNKSEMYNITSKWSPYRSIASKILWQIYDNELIS